MKRPIAGLFLSVIVLAAVPSFALTEFDADSIVNIMKRVAHYRMTYADISNLFNHASANKGDQPNVYEHANGGNNWDVGSFMTGLMALYYTTNDTAYLNFAKRWATYFNWQPYGGITTTNADNICCTQTYTEIYMLDPRTANNYMIGNTQQNLANLFGARLNPKTCWWWCDALYMAPPAIVLYCHAANQTAYLDSMYKWWGLVADSLYNKTYKFYYRDGGFIPPKNVCPNGKPMFWSCGVAWVIGGMARMLDHMPKTYANRPQLVSQFQEMCAAIKAEQGNNTPYPGLWTTSMLDHPDYPDPETSGSAFFCFAMAWGVRNGLLDSAAYNPCIDKAWSDLVKNIGTDGRLKRCQHVDWMPRADLSADVNNSSPEGEGAFLQAGYEMYLKEKGITWAKPATADTPGKSSLIRISGHSIIVEIKSPSTASLRLFSSNGRLVMDLSSEMRLMKNGPNTLSLENTGLATGIYRVALRDEGRTAWASYALLR
jgi:unsaturated rhamnogalacturonyl hydrolase